MHTVRYAPTHYSMGCIPAECRCCGEFHFLPSDNPYTGFFVYFPYKPILFKLWIVNYQLKKQRSLKCWFIRFLLLFLQKNSMETTALSKEMSDKVSFVTFIIPKFAAGYKMSMPDTYAYLKRYGGIDYLSQHWWALHTDNPFWALRSIAQVCRNNGGYLRWTFITAAIRKSRK